MAVLNCSTGLAEMSFADLTISSLRSRRRGLRVSGYDESITSPALSFDPRLLRFLVVRGAAMVGMGDGTVATAASFVGSDSGAGNTTQGLQVSLSLSGRRRRRTIIYNRSFDCRRVVVHCMSGSFLIVDVYVDSGL